MENIPARECASCFSPLVCFAAHKLSYTSYGGRKVRLHYLTFLNKQGSLLILVVDLYCCIICTDCVGSSR